MKRIYYLMAALLFSVASVSAQVTIGDNTDPHSGAVLELKTNTKGLLLPRINLEKVSVFQLNLEGTDTEADAAGMLIYNTNATVEDGDGVGLYVWDGTAWGKVTGGSNNGGGSGNGTGDITSAAPIPTIPAAGGSTTVTLITDCTTSGTWTITKVSGEGVLSNEDYTTGKFTVTYPENTTTNYLTTVVSVTDPCGYSKSFIVPQAPALTDPTEYQGGTGVFTGRTIFDIASSSVNDGKNNCGSLTDRSSRKTDFTNRTEQGPSAAAPYSGVQVYTFTPNGAVSNLRFVYVEEGIASGRVIESIVPKADYSENVVGAAQVAVSFKESLNTILAGLTRKNALKVSLYAIYNNGIFESGEEVNIRLQLSFQDCSSCGAKTAEGGWLDFLCFNLGADEVNGEAFTYSDYILGDLYQWGRRTDGHEKRTSDSNLGPVTSNKLDGNGQIASDQTDYGKFIKTSTSYTDWRNPSDAQLWISSEKTVADPCPSGWKVPSQEQWQTVRSANTWIWTGSGYTVGDALYLPAAGSRDYVNGNIGNNSLTGLYWSNTAFSATSPVSFHTAFSSGSVIVTGNAGRSNGISVRCVADN